MLSGDEESLKPLVAGTDAIPMKCPNCGADVAPELFWCPACAAPVRDPNPPGWAPASSEPVQWPPAPRPGPLFTQPAAGPPPQPSRNWKPVAGAVIAFVVLAAPLAYALVGRSPRPTKAATAPVRPVAPVTVALLGRYVAPDGSFSVRFPQPPQPMITSTRLWFGDRRWISSHVVGGQLDGRAFSVSWFDLPPDLASRAVATIYGQACSFQSVADRLDTQTPMSVAGHVAADCRYTVNPNSRAAYPFEQIFVLVGARMYVFETHAMTHAGDDQYAAFVASFALNGTVPATTPTTIPAAAAYDFIASDRSLTIRFPSPHGAEHAVNGIWTSDRSFVPAHAVQSQNGVRLWGLWLTWTDSLGAPASDSERYAAQCGGHRDKGETVLTTYPVAIAGRTGHACRVRGQQSASVSWIDDTAYLVANGRMYVFSLSEQTGTPFSAFLEFVRTFRFLTPPSPSSQALFDFAPSDGSFHVRFPNEPGPVVGGPQNVTATMPMSPSHVTSTTAGARTFSIQWIEFPTAPASTAGFYNARRAFNTGEGDTLLTEQATTVAGLPARDWTMRVGRLPYVYEELAVLHGRRLYMFETHATTGAGLDQWRAFVASFRLGPNG